MSRANRIVVNRIVLLLCVTMLLMGIAFGYPGYSKNGTNNATVIGSSKQSQLNATNININDTNDTTNDTTDVETADNTVVDTTDNTVADTDNVTGVEIPVAKATPKSPGFEIAIAIVSLSAIYILKRR